MNPAEFERGLTYVVSVLGTAFVLLLIIGVADLIRSNYRIRLKRGNVSKIIRAGGFIILAAAVPTRLGDFVVTHGIYPLDRYLFGYDYRFVDYWMLGAWVIILPIFFGGIGWMMLDEAVNYVFEIERREQ